MPEKKALADRQGPDNEKDVSQGENIVFSLASQASAFSCLACVFYEEIPLAGGHTRKLCHLSGKKNPAYGNDSCSFIAGKWENIDQVLARRKKKSLTPGQSEFSLNFPNTDRLSTGLAHAQHGENSGFFSLISHFPCPIRHECKLAATRPVSARTGGLSVTGERDAAFLFLKPLNTEV